MDCVSWICCLCTLSFPRILDLMIVSYILVDSSLFPFENVDFLRNGSCFLEMSMLVSIFLLVSMMFLGYGVVLLWMELCEMDWMAFILCDEVWELDLLVDVGCGRFLMVNIGFLLWFPLNSLILALYMFDKMSLTRFYILLKCFLDVFRFLAWA